MKTPRPYEDKIVYEDGNRPWVVYSYFPPTTLHQKLVEWLGRWNGWVQIFSSKTAAEAGAFIRHRKEKDK